MKTVRQQIIDLLEKEALDVRTLSQELHLMECEVYSHLEHIGRSVKTTGRKLYIDPPRCLHCGFVFQDRKKLSPPGHCPRCKGTYLKRPLYRVRRVAIKK